MSCYNAVVDERITKIRRGFVVGCTVSCTVNGERVAKNIFGFSPKELLDRAKNWLLDYSYTDIRVDYLYYDEVILNLMHTEQDKKNYMEFLTENGLINLRPMSHLNSVLVCLAEKCIDFTIRYEKSDETIHVSYKGSSSLEYTYLVFNQKGDLLAM